jgi:hypothetical protein
VGGADGRSASPPAKEHARIVKLETEAQDIVRAGARLDRQPQHDPQDACPKLPRVLRQVDRLHDVIAALQPLRDSMSGEQLKEFKSAARWMADVDSGMRWRKRVCRQLAASRGSSQDRLR